MIEKRTVIEFTCESKTLSTFLDAVTDTMTALQLVVPLGTPTKKSYTFPSFQRDQHEELSRKPVSAEPDLSGGRHHDDDQTVTQLTNLIKPVAGNQTPLSWLLILNKESGKAPQVKDTKWSKSAHSSVF